MDDNYQKKRCGNVSVAQKKQLIDFLHSHEEIRKGKFGPNFSKAKAKEIWSELAKNLNAIPGAQKSADQWKQTWFDLKKIAKKKNTHIKKYTNLTGGGGPTNVILNDTDEAVLGMINKTSLDGDSMIQESTSIIDIFAESVEGVEINSHLKSHTLDEINLVETEVETEYQKNTMDLEESNTEVIEPSVSRPAPKKVRKIIRKTLNPTNRENSGQLLQNHHDLIRISQDDLNLKKNYWNQKIKCLQEGLAIKRESLVVLKEIKNILMVQHDHSY